MKALSSPNDIASIGEEAFEIEICYHRVLHGPPVWVYVPMSGINCQRSTHAAVCRGRGQKPKESDPTYSGKQTAVTW